MRRKRVHLWKHTRSIRSLKLIWNRVLMSPHWTLEFIFYAMLMALRIMAWQCHQRYYHDVVMSAMASQITSLVIVYSTVYSSADQRKHEISASPAFVQEIHRWPVNSPHKGPVMTKMFPFWWRHHGCDMDLDILVSCHDILQTEVDAPGQWYRKNINCHWLPCELTLLLLDIGFTHQFTGAKYKLYERVHLVACLMIHSSPVSMQCPHKSIMRDIRHCHCQWHASQMAEGYGWTRK